jgi:type VI protein secretion system component VasF
MNQMDPARPPEKERRIYVTLPAGARRLFDQLVARKLYGDKDAEVARYLVIAKLDELVEKGRLVEPDVS